MGYSVPTLRRKFIKDFDFNPSQLVPFRDKAILDRIRNIKREDITKHPNPRFKIKVVKDDMVEHIFVTDMFHRIKSAADEGRKVVLITSNPNHGYIKKNLLNTIMRNVQL